MSLDPKNLGKAMADALPAAWQDLKGEPFPGGDTKDSEVMFQAVARGLLTYLKGHSGEIIKKITLTVPPAGDTTFDVKNVDIDTN
jgi:hypothetical protein